MISWSHLACSKLKNHRVCKILQNIATKDIAAKKIERDLLNDGQKQLNQFVQERLLSSDEVKFRDPLHKNKPMTFASLYEPTKSLKTGKEKEKIINEVSIKSATRTRRTRPIRRIIEHANVPLPSNWSNFISLSENKADLARFLSQQLIVQAPNSKVIVAAGGFSSEEMVESSRSDLDTEPLEAWHEEADTRIVLHCPSLFVHSQLSGHLFLGFPEGDMF